VTKDDYLGLMHHASLRDRWVTSRMFDYFDYDHDGVWRLSEWPLTFHETDLNSTWNQYICVFTRSRGRCVRGGMHVCVYASVGFSRARVRVSVFFTVCGSVRECVGARVCVFVRACERACVRPCV
jgi:hypothetical protein